MPSTIVPHAGASQDRPPEWPPPVINTEQLSKYPAPIQLMVATAALPLEVAFTSFRILRHTEALLGEMVLLLGTLRPAVAGVSNAYANGQFDQVFRTIDQIQHSTNAIALVWSPLNAVRDRLVPGLSPDPPAAQAVPPRRPMPPMTALPAAPPRRPPQPSQQPHQPPPSTGEWLGRIGDQVWDHANAIPGAGLLTGPLRRVSSALADAAPRPVAAEEAPAPVGMVVDPDEDTVEEPVRPGPSLLPGPVRRWFGG